jgi:signal transduction histidine kinase
MVPVCPTHIYLIFERFWRGDISRSGGSGFRISFALPV